jgi:hypothetical protein
MEKSSFQTIIFGFTGMVVSIWKDVFGVDEL